MPPIGCSYVIYWAIFATQLLPALSLPHILAIMRLMYSSLLILVAMLCTMIHVALGVPIPIEATQHAPHHDAKAQARLFDHLTHSLPPTTPPRAPTQSHPLAGETVNARSAETKGSDGRSDSNPTRDERRLSTDGPTFRKRTRRM